MNTIKKPEDSDGDGSDRDDEPKRELKVKNHNVWKLGDKGTKDQVLAGFLKYFGGMVKQELKEYSLADDKGRYKPDDYVYHKLLDSSQCVYKVKNLLLDNDDPDTRDFIIYISNQRWVNNKFAPLLELCAKDDSLLAMRCCGLAMVLVKAMSRKTRRLMVDVPKQRKKSVNDLTGPDEEDHNSGDEDVATEVDVANAKQQLIALLSFKEALSSALCNEALTNAFRDYWTREQAGTQEENKLYVSVCFSYIRRVLAIEPHTNWSTAGEITTHHRVHHKYITRLKQVISVIPGICGDLDRNRKYHEDWLADIIKIIFYVLRDFDAKQLFLAYTTDALISSFRNILGDAPETEEEAEAIEIKQRQNLHPVVVPALFKAGVREAKATTGGLMDMIKKDQIGRQARAAVGTDSNRFRSVYRVVKGGESALPATASSSSSTSSVEPSRISSGRPNSVSQSTAQSAAIVSPQNPANSTAAANKSSVTIFHNPFSTSEGIIPQAKAKASKKSLTFAADASNDTVVVGSAMGDDFQQACIVAASLTEIMSHELAFKTFVRRVNDILRRDEQTLERDDVLMYYQVVTKLLSYHRLKLAREHAQFIQQQKATPSSAVWEPNLKNVMDALDNMSFQRVVHSITHYMTPATGAELKYTTTKEKLSKLHIPMTLLKEMICYLRVLLESGLEGHHEIAIAALYRLYYTSSADRQDPLGKLLTQWRAGAFSRRHVDSLIELVHETLSTLDTAHRMYSDEDSPDKKKRSKIKKDQSLETYIVTCMRFDVNEYFRRLVSNHSVRMYTRVLQNYDTNDIQVNGHTYKFLHRMCSFKLEQMCKAPMPSLDGKPAVLSAMDYEEVHLGFILFNIQTLLVFSTILSDPEICANASRYTHLRPLVALIHSLVRRFGEASKKNNLIFLELIFQHPRPDAFCSQLDSVYEAPYYARSSSGFNGSGSAQKKKRRGGGSDDDSLSANSSGEEEDFGDVFDENNVSAAFAATSAKQLRDEAKRAKAAKEGAGKRSSQIKKLKSRKKEWSAAEDEALRNEYIIYAGSSGVFTSITESASLRDLGGDRREQHVRARCKELGLTVVYESDAEGGDGDDEEERGSPMRSAHEGEEDTYPQDAIMVTQDADTDMSPPLSAHNTSARKKARLVLRDASVAELPRAAWDTDETTDVFEQRSLGLASGSSASKKLFRKSAVAGGDSDDDIMGEEEEDVRAGNQAPLSKAAVSKSRSMRIASDDEDE